MAGKALARDMFFLIADAVDLVDLPDATETESISATVVFAVFRVDLELTADDRDSCDATEAVSSFSSWTLARRVDRRFGVLTERVVDWLDSSSAAELCDVRRVLRRLGVRCVSTPATRGKTFVSSSKRLTGVFFGVASKAKCLGSETPRNLRDDVGVCGAMSIFVTDFARALRRIGVNMVD